MERPIDSGAEERSTVLGRWGWNRYGCEEHSGVGWLGIQTSVSSTTAIRRPVKAWAKKSLRVGVLGECHGQSFEHKKEELG